MPPRAPRPAADPNAIARQTQHAGGLRTGIVRWRKLEHHGVQFPPPYEPHGRPLLYQGHAVKLAPSAEEFATLWARLERRKPWLTSDPRVRHNFWADWKQILSAPAVRDLDSCDFSRMATPQKLQTSQQAGSGGMGSVALVDGVAQPVANPRIEGPTVFDGGRRGAQHPLAGKIRRRLKPADVTVNLDAQQAVRARARRVRWGAVVTEPCADWLACWRDPLTGVVKYMRLSRAAGPEQANDQDKFDLARAAIARGTVRRPSGPRSDEGVPACQLGACVWLLRHLALRAGGDPARSEVDARGLTTLLVRDVQPGARPGTLLFDFPGKDHVRYHRTVEGVAPEVSRCVLASRLKKARDAPLFEGVTAASLNANLDGLLSGLSAKVLRTAAASELYESMLNMALAGWAAKGGEQAARAAHALAEAGAAWLCNHRRAQAAPGSGRPVDDAPLGRRLIQMAASAAPGPSLAQVRTLIRKEGLAPTTTRSNYIDPRITAAFCSRTGVPLDHVWPATLRARFAWALSTPGTFRFSAPGTGLKDRGGRH